jgi:hypothetical protein
MSRMKELSVEIQQMNEMIGMEAVLLRGNTYAVRPKGQLGTCGWHPYPWTVQYIRARSASEAVFKANNK